jgi:hypothetical protein
VYSVARWGEEIARAGAWLVLQVALENEGDGALPLRNVEG